MIKIQSVSIRVADVNITFEVILPEDAGNVPFKITAESSQLFEAKVNPIVEFTPIKKC